MVKLLILFWLITIFCSKTYSDCSFINFERSAPPIFTRSYGRYDVLADFEGSTINIEEDEILYLHCPSKLRDVQRNFQNFAWFGIQCLNQEIQYISVENTYNTDEYRNYYSHYNNQPTFKCDNKFARFFTNSNSQCAHDGYLYGYEFSFPRPINIILAEFCYDFKTFDTVYVHYVAGYQSSALQKLVELNPGGKAYENISPVASLPGLDKTEIDPIFFNEYIPVIRDYVIGELVPFGSIAPDFQNYLTNEAANRIVWWSPLKYRNWDKYSQILRTASLERIFEVFAGKSGHTMYPHKDCDLDKKLMYKDGKKLKYAPLYIWNYIIPRNDYNNSFVLIGVNSPFMEFKADRNNGTIFCEDICDEIDWLKPLKRTRKMPAMGYIFCCKPDEVKHVLLGFPQIQYPFVDNTKQSFPESKYPFENNYNYSSPVFNSVEEEYYENERK